MTCPKSCKGLVTSRRFARWMMVLLIASLAIYNVSIGFQQQQHTAVDENVLWQGFREKQDDIHASIATRRMFAPESSGISVLPIKIPKILVYVTTIYSKDHVRALECCWPTLLLHSKLFQMADVLFFASNVTEISDYDEIIGRIGAIFQQNRVRNNLTATKSPPTVRFEFATMDDLPQLTPTSKYNRQYTRKQLGANFAVHAGFAKGYFAQYDWVIRINPDVLIRQSTPFLMNIFLNGNDNSNEKIDGIFHPCQPRQIHTDFFAMRPNKVMADYSEKNVRDNPTAVTTTTDKNTTNFLLFPFASLVNNNHEQAAYSNFASILNDSSRWIGLPSDTTEPWTRGGCRMRGEQSTIIHAHRVCEKDANVCEALQGWNIT